MPLQRRERTLCTRAVDVQMKLNVMVGCRRGEGKRFYLVEIHSQRPRNPGNPGICGDLTEFNKEFEAWGK
jgi:hypothetical protein